MQYIRLIDMNHDLYLHTTAKLHMSMFIKGKVLYPGRLTINDLYYTVNSYELVMELSCSTNLSEILLISDLCTNDLSRPLNGDLCFPKELADVSIYLGAWSIFIGILGFFGNLMTLIALPFASKRKKYA